MEDEKRLKELEARLGTKISIVKEDAMPGDSLNPQKPPKPEPRRGIKPPVPIVPPSQLMKYKEEPRKMWEAFASGKEKTYDPELNEYALKRVAEERGITVEELLASQGTKMPVKVNPLEIKSEIETPKEIAMEKPTYQEKIAQLKAELARTEAEAEAMATHEEEEKEAPIPVPAPVPAAPKKKTHKQLNPGKKPANPALEKLRMKLSLLRHKPYEIVVEGIAFEVLPPPTRLQPWIFSQLTQVREFGMDAVNNVMKVCTAAASIRTIEGEPAAEVLGLVDKGTTTNKYEPKLEVHLMQAQALFEMFSGDSSIESLFPLDPSLANKIHEGYMKAFGDVHIKSSVDPDDYHFMCPVEGCKETKDAPLIDGIAYFCSLHATPLDPKGKTSEVKSLPLA